MTKKERKIIGLMIKTIKRLEKKVEEQEVELAEVERIVTEIVKDPNSLFS